MGVKVYKRQDDTGKNLLLFEGLDITVSESIPEKLRNNIKIKIIQAMVREKLVEMKLVDKIIEEEKEDENGE